MCTEMLYIIAMVFFMFKNKYNANEPQYFCNLKYLY